MIGSNTVAWGIVGTGAIAHAFATAIADSQTGRLAAIASRDAKRAEKFAKDHGAEQGYGSLQAMLQSGIQALYIATPHTNHAEAATACIEAGIPVFCEKPVALNAAQAEAVFELAETRGVLIAEAFKERAHPQTHKLLELIKKGAIGDVQLIEAAFAYRMGKVNPEGRHFNPHLAGGGIMDVGCYPANIARLVAGAALGQPYAHPKTVKAVGQLSETGVDAWTCASVLFERGIQAQLVTGIQMNHRNDLNIFGTEGSLHLKDPWANSRTDGGTFTIVQKNKSKTKEHVIEVGQTSFALEADVFGQAVLDGKTELDPPNMTREDSLSNLRLLDAWRDQIGLVFPAETQAHLAPPVHGGSLRRPAEPTIPSEKLEGVSKPISRLIMGCDNQTTLRHSAMVFDAFFEAGGNTFDTAFIYGRGIMEKLLGQWIQARGVRDEVSLIIKTAHTPNNNPESIRKQIPICLERLQTDKAELHFMHRDNPDVPVGEFVDVLNEFYDQGKIERFGGSNWSSQRIDEANAYAKANGKQGFTLVSNNFSLARMVEPVWGGCVASSEDGFRQWHEQTQTPLFPWSSQARGFFTDRAGPKKLDDPSLVKSWYSPDNFKRRERAIQLAEQYGVTPINIALAYVLKQAFPAFALIGPRTLRELRTSLPGLGVDLSPQEVQWLDLRIDSL